MSREAKKPAAETAQHDHADPAAEQQADPRRQAAMQKRAQSRRDRPDWTPEQLVAIQTELKRLGLYSARIDGLFGAGTQRGLETAAGPDWRTQTPESIVEKLKAEKGGGDEEQQAEGDGPADQTPPPGAAKAGDPRQWTRDQLTAIQTELKRLGLYHTTIDGRFGPGTQRGLDAGVGAGWQSETPEAIVDKLKAKKGAGEEEEKKPEGGEPGAKPAVPEAGKPDAAVGETPKDATTGWSKDQVRAMQKELLRLGLYQGTLDGLPGKGTESALVEAFGGDEWRRLQPAEITSRLVGAEPPKGKKGDHNFKYGEMFKDGVLDLTLGIGFDEGGSHEETIKTFSEVLAGHKFAENRGAAEQIYQQAGRALGESAFGQFFVRKDALTYKPPAGDARSVHAVVRLVSNPDGASGGAAASAFKQGMAESDVAYYSGHGRYGSGPDFDRNMSFELKDEAGEVEQTIDDYEQLEKLLQDEGKSKGRDAWAQFQWRVAHNRIEVKGENEGNVFLNPEDKHANEFGGKLMYWNLQQKGGGGATPVTGKGGEMDKAQEKQDEKQRDYHLMVFDGCRTQDYSHAIRSTPGYDAGKADVLDTKRTLQWGDEARTLAAFLDGVLGMQSAEKIVKGMDAEQSPENAGGAAGGAYQADGLQDNPVVR